MSTVPPPEQPDERSGEEPPSITDEQLEAFLRDAESGGGAPPPKEPSARARMVTRRLREADETATAPEGRGGRGRRWGRKKDRAPQQWTPPGWRTGPAWQEMNGKRRGVRRGLLSALGVAVAVVLAVLAIRPSLLLGAQPGPDSASAPPPLAAETARPSGAPGEAPNRQPTPEQPFLGSPARAWAEGADAIEVPEAKAAGGLSKGDVALALRHVKEFLVATNLDPAVLRGGRPKEALSLLDPKQPDLLDDVRRSLRDPDREHDPKMLISRFDADDVRPVGNVVKVRGRMSFEAGRPGEVRVHADYTFVYPLVMADGDDDRVARTIVRRELTMTVADPRKWIATKDKLLLEEYDAEYFNDECGIDDGWFHPVFPGDAPVGGGASGAAEDPYDRSDSLRADGSEEGDCGTTSRT
ncbi:hypothetical protein ACFY93_02530 [Streptomyces sp. NPDC008313]|uniref:hypothetical protein n=1 Tax=Streptomyces sp. NPDC008313 TaxID=3364826 RepID=UPI0036F06965